MFTFGATAAVGQAGVLGAGGGTGEQRVDDQHVGRVPVDRVGQVRRVERCRSEEQQVADLAHLRERVPHLPVADEGPLGVTRPGLRCPLPGRERGAGVGRLLLDGVVAQHDDLVAPGDELGRESELGRDRPAAVPRGEEEPAHRATTASHSSVIAAPVARALSRRSMRRSFHV